MGTAQGNREKAVAESQIVEQMVYQMSPHPRKDKKKKKGANAFSFDPEPEPEPVVEAPPPPPPEPEKPAEEDPWGFGTVGKKKKGKKGDDPLEGGDGADGFVDPTAAYTPRPVPLRQLFRFATPFELLLNACGLVCAIGAGAGLRMREEGHGHDGGRGSRELYGFFHEEQAPPPQPPPDPFREA